MCPSPHANAEQNAPAGIAQHGANDGRDRRARQPDRPGEVCATYAICCGPDPVGNDTCVVGTHPSGVHCMRFPDFVRLPNERTIDLAEGGYHDPQRGNGPLIG